MSRERASERELVCVLLFFRVWTMCRWTDIINGTEFIRSTCIPIGCALCTALLAADTAFATVFAQTNRSPAGSSRKTVKFERWWLLRCAKTHLTWHHLCDTYTHRTVYWLRARFSSCSCVWFRHFIAHSPSISVGRFWASCSWTQKNLFNLRVIDIN